MVEQAQIRLENTNSFKNIALTNSEGKSFLAPKAYVEPEQKQDVVELKSEKSENIAGNVPPKKSHKKRNMTIAVGTSALAVGGGVLLLTKGMPKNTQKYLEKFKDFLEKKLENSTSKGSDKLSEVLEYSIRKVDSFIIKLQSVNNFTTLKDIVLKWFMGSNKYTGKAHKGITDFFERVARKTVVTSYKSANKNFDNMYRTFDKLDEYILKTNPDEIIRYEGKEYTKKELIEMAKAHREQIKNTIGDFTSTSQCWSRYRYIKQATSDLYDQFLGKLKDKFWSKDNIFLKREMYETYIPDVQITGNKKTLNEQVAAVRKCISYNDRDKTEIISRYLKTIKNLIPPYDKEGMEIIKKLEWYTKNPEGLKENVDVFTNMLSHLQTRPVEKGLDEVASQNTLKLRELNITNIKELLDESNVGELQKMLSIYKKFAPEMASFKAENSVRKAVASLDKAIKTETVDFFDKVRDLQLGSAPTDIIGIAAPTAMIGYGLAAAEDSDERQSVMYKAGMPVIGSIATTIYCTTKLISGGISLALAGLTGVLFNAVGSGIDSYRHKSAAKNHTNG